MCCTAEGCNNVASPNRLCVAMRSIIWRSLQDIILCDFFPTKYEVALRSVCVPLASTELFRLIA